MRRQVAAMRKEVASLKSGKPAKPAKGKKGKEPAAMPRRKGDTTGDILTNAISGVLSNF